MKLNIHDYIKQYNTTEKHKSKSLDTKKIKAISQLLNSSLKMQGYITNKDPRCTSKTLTLIK